jgi:hypothetical protein
MSEEISRHENAELGDDVHYVSFGTPRGEYESMCRTAKVTEPDRGLLPDAERYPGRLIDSQVETCALIVFNPTGMFFNSRVIYDESRAPGTWHWPHS